MNYRCRPYVQPPVCPLHPVPNRHENSPSRQRKGKTPRVLEIWCLGVGVLHGCALPIGPGIPWRNHSTTATSGSLCCHRWSFQRSLATSSRWSLCSLGHCACRRAEHLAIHSLVSIAASPKISVLLFCTVYEIWRKSKRMRDCFTQISESSFQLRISPCPNPDGANVAT